MTPRLRTLLAALGTAAVVAGGVLTTRALLAPRPGTGRAAFLDAGMLGCQVVRLTCPVRNDCPAEGARYGTREVCARDCGDAGIVLRWPRRDGGTGAECMEVLGDCVLEPDDGGSFCQDDGGAGSFFPSRITADSCLCVDPDAGSCLVPGLDGGATEALPGITYPVGVGPGCVRKPCRERGGELGQSWPEECPR